MGNEYVRGSVGVDSFMAQSRLRWFGHISRMQSDDAVKKVWEWDSEETLSRGRPEQTWMLL